MFTIYQKKVGDRISNRYFKKWDNARKALDKELEEMKRYGWKINARTDRMNGEKGFYMYETEGVTNENETFSLALLEGHFEDNKD